MRNRTSIAHLRVFGTKRAQLGRRYLRFSFAAFVLLTSASDVAAAEAAHAGSQQRLQAEGWLQLKQDQKTFREGVQPLQPRGAATLDRLERGQQERFRALESRQRQSRQRNRARQTGADAKRPVSPPREFKEQRQFDRQRLQGRIQRETLRPGSR
jgi:hypothetical protein